MLIRQDKNRLTIAGIVVASSFVIVKFTPIGSITGDSKVWFISVQIAAILTLIAGFLYISCVALLIGSNLRRLIGARITEKTADTFYDITVVCLFLNILLVTATLASIVIENTSPVLILASAIIFILALLSIAGNSKNK